MNKIRYIVFPVLFLSLIFSGCEKEDPLIPEFVGTWSHEWEDISESDTIRMKELLIFTESTYEDHLQFYHPYRFQWKSWVALKGSLSAESYKMDINIDQVGYSTGDSYGLPSGNLNYYNQGSGEFTELISLLGISTTLSYDFSIAGNTMTLLNDINDDGDFSDPGEALIIYREE